MLPIVVNLVCLPRKNLIHGIAENEIVMVNLYTAITNIPLAGSMLVMVEFLSGSVSGATNQVL